MWAEESGYQFWTPLELEYSFCNQRNIQTLLAEKEYHERLVDAS